MSTAQPTYQQLSAGVGALLIGNLIATAVWGISSFQTYTYFQTPAPAVDSTRMRILVLILWILDTLHILLVSRSVYFYLVVNYNHPDGLANIEWSLGITIAITGIITFIVHSFFARRIYILSRCKLVVPAVTVLLAAIRVGFAVASTTETFRLKSFEQFGQVVRWLFTTGLALAVISDSIITGACCYYLSINRSGFARMDAIIKTLQRYLIQSGALTAVTSLISALFAVFMPTSMAWIAAHFVISKTYTFSLVAALNSRDALREARLDPENPTQPLELSGLKISVATVKEVDGGAKSDQLSGLRSPTKHGQTFYYNPSSRTSVQRFPMSNQIVNISPYSSSPFMPSTPTFKPPNDHHDQDEV